MRIPYLNSTFHGIRHGILGADGTVAPTFTHGGLEEPGSRQAKARDGDSSGELEGGEQVDNLAAGGFFGLYGRERTGAHPTVIPPFARPAASPAPASEEDESNVESDGGMPA